MDEKIIQLVDGTKAEYNARSCYVSTGQELIFIKKEEDSKTWKLIHMASIHTKEHLISVITAPSISIRFNTKEELEL